MLVLSSSNDIESNKFKEEHKLDIEFFTIDQTVCKTAMRANPGLMLLHNGTIQGKWSYANYPNFSTLNLDLKDNALPLFPVAAPAPVAPVDTVSTR